MTCLKNIRCTMGKIKFRRCFLVSHVHEHGLWVMTIDERKQLFAPIKSQTGVCALQENCRGENQYQAKHQISCQTRNNQPSSKASSRYQMILIGCLRILWVKLFHALWSILAQGPLKIRRSGYNAEASFELLKAFSSSATSLLGDVLLTAKWHSHY